MLKEDPRYDYIESSEPPPVETRAPRRSRKLRHLSLPVNFSLKAVAFAMPLQAYLADRFAHIGGKDRAARALRDENQRKHDHAASLGHWQMSRTS